ncbi:MAG: lysoplasmalogenase [Candidatus Heimdallarchaeaceae archaeon]
METVSIILFVLLIFFSLIHLLGEFLVDNGKEKFIIVRYLTKPFLMPLLLLFYVIGNVNINWLISSAIISGFVGDIFLMLPDPEKTRKWLRIGLVSFLIGHLLYIAAFIYIAGNFVHFVWWSVLLAIPFVIAAVLIQPRMTQHTGKMTTAVTIYIIVIGLMGISTTFLFGYGTFVGILLLYLGAWFFAVSDTLNGYVKFVKVFKYERVITMFTYILGQLLIVLGVLFL